MRKIIIGLLAVGFVGFGLGEWRSLAADEAPASGASSATPAAAGGAQPGGPMLGPATPPLDLVASTPKGQLKNPYNANIATLRIVDDTLWEAVKTRQGAIRDSDRVANARATRFWERRRSRHLLRVYTTSTTAPSLLWHGCNAQRKGRPRDGRGANDNRSDA